jgi:hypothetical protein
MRECTDFPSGLEHESLREEEEGGVMFDSRCDEKPGDGVAKDGEAKDALG